MPLFLHIILYIDQDEDEKSHGCNCWFWLLGFSTLALYVLSFTLCGLFFKWYGDVGTSNCSGHRTLISLTIVICLINAVLSGIRGDGSFFVSSVVSFYCTFLCFAALQADDDKTCNIWADDRDRYNITLHDIIYVKLFIYF